MEHGHPSQTAITMAVLRAHHYLFNDAPRILDDSLAMKLVGLRSRDDVAMMVGRFEDMLARHSDRRQVRDRVHAIMMGTCVRSRLVEDQLAASLARGMRQVVILGAGLDTLAYRCHALTKELDVFEVDFPASQNWKRQRLAASGISLPHNLTFVPCDFEHQTLTDALEAGGVRQDRMTLFTWLGVQCYLTDTSVVTTLNTIATFPTGSEVVMDLLTTPPDREGDDIRQGSDKVLAAIGEPWQSWYEPDAFADILRTHGYGHIDLVSYPDWLGRNAARFQHRYSSRPTPFVLISAQVE